MLSIHFIYICKNDMKGPIEEFFYQKTFNEIPSFTSLFSQKKILCLTYIVHNGHSQNFKSECSHI